MIQFVWNRLCIKADMLSHTALTMLQSMVPSVLLAEQKSYSVKQSESRLLASSLTALPTSDSCDCVLGTQCASSHLVEWVLLLWHFRLISIIIIITRTIILLSSSSSSSSYIIIIIIIITTILTVTVFFIISTIIVMIIRDLPIVAWW